MIAPLVAAIFFFLFAVAGCIRLALYGAPRQRSRIVRLLNISVALCFGMAILWALQAVLVFNDVFWLGFTPSRYFDGTALVGGEGSEGKLSLKIHAVYPTGALNRSGDVASGALPTSIVLSVGGTDDTEWIIVVEGVEHSSKPAIVQFTGPPSLEGRAYMEVASGDVGSSVSRQLESWAPAPDSRLESSVAAQVGRIAQGLVAGSSPKSVVGEGIDGRVSVALGYNLLWGPAHRENLCLGIVTALALLWSGRCALRGLAAQPGVETS